MADRSSTLSDTTAPGATNGRTEEVDVAIVGAGPAGLSAALVLGRARRRVLVLDTGKPANARSPAVGGLLAQMSVAPLDLRRVGREQITSLPNVEVRDAEVVDVDDLTVRLDDGSAVRSRALVLAHGLSYEPPDVPGIDGLWGRSVFHCPFCDGWEVRDLQLAVLGGGSAAVRSALLVSGWTSDVVLLTDGPSQHDAGDREALAAAGVRLREEKVARLVGGEGWLDHIEFVDGEPEYRDALFVRTRRDQPNGLAEALECQLTLNGTILTDGDGRTGVPGVYAAGDASTENLRSVANAIGTGSRAAYGVALDLVGAPARH
jgi:thioredoxin reductase